MARAAAAAPRPRKPPVEREMPKRGRPKTPTRHVPPPLEHRILMTATLCLLAFGAVMVYSASSPRDLLGGQGNGTTTFVRYLMFAGIGVVAMHVLERRGLTLFNERLAKAMLVGSFVLLALVMVPGFGVQVNGARRWFAM